MQLTKYPSRRLGFVMGVIAFLSINLCNQSYAQRQSGYELMSPENQRMQNDLNLNPAYFWILDGQDIWNSKNNPQSQSCASCHQDPKSSMRGVATKFPLERAGKLINLEQQINYCQSERLSSKPFTFESKALLAITTFVATQSRDQPITTHQNSSFLNNAFRNGEMLFNQRMGQLNLSCAQCHEQRAGLILGGTKIPQAHPTAYPIYRLEWQNVGSLQRRLRNCMTGVRAEPFDYGSSELVQLELFLMRRANGMRWETPGVRP